MDFFINTDNDGGHALWDVGTHPFNKKSRENVITRKIKMITIDKIIELHKLNNVKLIKIDTEGAEYQVLKGAITSLSNAKIPYIIAEINRFGLKKMNTSEQELRNYMSSLGYTTYFLATNSSKPIKLSANQVVDTHNIFNVLFTNQNIE